MPPIMIQRGPSTPAAGKISVKSRLPFAIQTKISSFSKPDGDEKFFVVNARHLEVWSRGAAEVLFTNGDGQGPLDTTYVLPGEEYDVMPININPNRVSLGFGYTPCANGCIGVRNNSDFSIQVAVSNATNSNGSAQFYTIPAGSNERPGTINPWARSGPEVIYITYPGSNRVITYLGVLGQNLDINEPITPITPRTISTPGPGNEIIVHNYLDADIEVAVSTTTNSGGCARFYTIPAKRGAVPGTINSWARSGPEIIYVKDTTTSRIAVYYGSLGTILNIHEIGA